MPLSTFTLLRLLEEPDAPELAAARAQLAESGSSRRTLARLIRLQDLLLEEAWERAIDAARLEPLEPLPPGLERSLRAIGAPSVVESYGPATPGLESAGIAGSEPAGIAGLEPAGAAGSEPESPVTTEAAAAGALEPASAALLESAGAAGIRPAHAALEPVRNREPARGAYRLRVSRWARGLGALAAALLLIAGARHLLWQRSNPGDAPDAAPRMRGNPPSGAEVPGADDGESDEGVAPLALWVQNAWDRRAKVPSLEVLAPGVWRIEVHDDATVQLRVRRPATLSPDETWSADATLWRRTADGTRTPLDLPALEARGSAVDPDMAVGRPVRLEMLTPFGFGPGDTLEYEVHRGLEVYHLDVVLVSHTP